MRYADHDHFTICQSHNGVIVNSTEHVTEHHAKWRVPPTLRAHNFHLYCTPDPSRLPPSAAYFANSAFQASTSHEWFSVSLPADVYSVFTCQCCLYNEIQHSAASSESLCGLPTVSSSPLHPQFLFPHA